MLLRSNSNSNIVGISIVVSGQRPSTGTDIASIPRYRAWYNTY